MYPAELDEITAAMSCRGFVHCSNERDMQNALTPSSILLRWRNGRDTLFAEEMEVFTNMRDLGVSKIYSKGGDQVGILGEHLAVSIIKDDDDWFWVFVDGFRTGMITEDEYRAVFGGQAPIPDFAGKTVWMNVLERVWRCDQVQGVLDYLSSGDFARVLSRYPGRGPSR